VRQYLVSMKLFCGGNADDDDGVSRKCLDFVVALAVAGGGFGEHESTHPLDLLVGVLDGEVVAFRGLLEDFAGVGLVCVWDEGEGKAGLRVGEAGAEDGLLE
jgi:hypothetical protein